MHVSSHLTHRLRNRFSVQHLSSTQEQYVLEHGHPIERDGLIMLVLRRRDIPEADRHQEDRTVLCGTVLVLDRRGVVVHVYRRVPTTRRICVPPRHASALRHPVVLLSSVAVLAPK